MNRNWSRPFLFLLRATVCAVLCMACGSSTPDPVPQVPRPIEPGAPIPFAQVEDNVKHDTLLIQVTFDLGDGTHLMVASHVEERFEGLRLYRYKAHRNNSAELIAVSNPGYESWTMLPTFFQDPLDSNAYILLTNWGGRESWGQKVLRMDKDGFHDLCFLDVALPERIVEDDSTRVRRLNIAPLMRCSAEGGGLRFSFACDSLYLYDDFAGGLDKVTPSVGIHYTWDANEGLLLWIGGGPRKPAPLSS
jgi:hypothetical protein